MKTLRARAMLMPRGIPIVAMIALAAATGGCSYDPHPADGKLACSADGQCPQGYACRFPAATCFSGAATSGAGGGTGGGAPAGTGGSPSSTNASDYVGTWTFGNSANIVTSCNDGLGDATTIIAEHPDSLTMTIAAGGSTGAALLSVWLCELQLGVDTTGAHLGGGVHVCAFNRAANDPTSDPVTQTWTATRFDFNVTKRDRGVATHVGEYDLVRLYASGSTVTCHQVVRGALQKP